jgi:hypothetical protein
MTSRLPRFYSYVLEDYWSSDVGTEFLDKWFSIPKIFQYFRTRSPVTMTDRRLTCVGYNHPVIFE